MKLKLNIKDIVLIIIVLVLVVVNLALLTKVISLKSEPKDDTRDKSNVTNENNQNKSEEEQELEKLKKMTERDRMEYYFAKFIKYIKDEKYTEAYNLLYPEFRQTYFKSVEEFRDYAKKIYPSSVGFSYNDIERQGTIYVLVIKIIDPAKKVGEEKDQRIVIQENDFNDFVLSFQVI